MEKITTETGRVYVIDYDRGFWWRLDEHVTTERLYDLQVGESISWPWNVPEHWQPGRPQVGKYMFISSNDVWWTSTKVVKIEEIGFFDMYAANES